jgi:hypothetical protein
MDNIEFEILEDGTITTRIGGAVSDSNHLSADKLLRQIETLAGGETSREKIAKGHTHANQGSHAHNEAGV